MKTSFYIALWILIYPLLRLLDSSFVNENSFLVALAAIWGISVLLARAMPKYVAYSGALEVFPILESVYQGDVEAFRKRLAFDTAVETTSAVYYFVALAVVLVLTLGTGLNNWIALAIFAFFAFGSINCAVKYLKAKSGLSANPTGEQCRDIAVETYRLDYAAYYENRVGRSFQDVLPECPPQFKAFQIASLVIAAICTFLGLYYFLFYLTQILVVGGVAATAFYGMYLLYGTLAICFGVKDAITIWKSLKKPNQ